MTDGKNLPILNELFKADTGKEGLKKDGTASKALIDYVKEKFKPMKQTVIKHFATCAIDIDKGVKSADECYSESKDKAFASGSVYVSPAMRWKTKQKELEEKYGIKF